MNFSGMKGTPDSLLVLDAETGATIRTASGDTSEALLVSQLRSVVGGQRVHVVPVVGGVADKAKFVELRVPAPTSFDIRPSVHLQGPATPPAQASPIIVQSDQGHALSATQESLRVIHATTVAAHEAQIARLEAEHDRDLGRLRAELEDARRQKAAVTERLDRAVQAAREDALRTVEAERERAETRVARVEAAAEMRMESSAAEARARIADAETRRREAEDRLVKRQEAWAEERLKLATEHATELARQHERYRKLEAESEADRARIRREGEEAVDRARQELARVQAARAEERHADGTRAAEELRKLRHEHDTALSERNAKIQRLTHQLQVANDKDAAAAAYDRDFLLKLAEVPAERQDAMLKAWLRSKGIVEEQPSDFSQWATNIASITQSVMGLQKQNAQPRSAGLPAPGTAAPGGTLTGQVQPIDD